MRQRTVPVLQIKCERKGILERDEEDGWGELMDGRVLER